ncbi:TonB-dependent receptor, partial [Verrucomicrobia bacterium]|nr:TonB-dependent receptor [Verrucomicrobiota bacterium]
MNCFDFSVIIRFVLKTSIRCRLVTFGVYLSSVTLFLADEMSNDEAVNLRSLSIEELLDVKVTSVSKKSESVSRSAAAITVISQEDIRRSGAMSLPEAIRLAPGMQVAAIDAANWAVSARGFNDIFANKLLVMIDGRPIYTPLFSGVYWDAQETFMEDIDRIEIVRGPGATMWGANAVNGVINVISRDAKDTQGMLAFGTLGTELLGSAGFRYGFQLREDLHMRVYGQYQERDSLVLSDGSDSSDDYELGQGGFRLDWEPSAQNKMTFQGDVYGGASSYLADSFPAAPPFTGQVVRTPNIGGGNLLGRWNHYFSDDSPLSLQMFYDHTARDTGFIEERRTTFDIDLQQRFPIGPSFEMVVGGNYRHSRDDLVGPLGLAVLPQVDSFNPAEETLELRSGFVQGGWDIIDDELNFTLGSKFEDNDYTGMEIQPSARLRWQPIERHTLWGAVSRAVRTPSRTERGIQFTQAGAGLPGIISFRGSDEFRSEDMMAYEVGYRMQQNERLSWDIATFYNVYDRLQTREISFPTLVGGFPVFPVTAANKMQGESYGVEIALNWHLTDWWRIKPSYSFLEINVERDAGSTDVTSHTLAGSSPQQTFSA